MNSNVVQAFLNPPLRDCGGRLSAEVVRDWQSSLLHPLPSSYLEFLEVFNGGKFYPSFGTVFPFEFEGDDVLPDIWDGIHGITLFGLRENWNWRSLEWNLDVHDGRIPGGCIPIGSSGNDLIILDCRRGDLHLWTRDIELMTTPEQNRIFVVESFEAFASGLIRLPRDQWLLQITSAEEPMLSIELHELQGLQDWVAAQVGINNLPDRGLELLQACLQAEDFDGTEWLLKQGANPNGLVKDGTESPIQIAEGVGCGDIVVLLLESGADPSSLFLGKRKPQDYILDFVEQWQLGQRTSRRKE